jgi:PST family polysaccharide transporter
MRWRILRGVAWQGSATMLARGARTVTWLVLGGLLGPREFGSFAAIYVVIDGLYLLQELGLPQALIVRRERIDESADSIFALTLLLGVVFAAIGWSLAPWVASFYDDPSLTAPFRALSVVLIVHSLRVVPLRLFERDLDFRRKVAPTAWGAATYVVTSIVIAWAGGGIWALVGATAESLAFWIASPWRPKWRFALDVVREDARFGLPVVAAALLAYACWSLDRIVLGRYAGGEVLGAYAFALSLAMVPSTVGSSVVNSVLLPSYSGLGQDRDVRRDLHLTALSLVGGLNLLFVALVVALGGPFLQAVYGSKWDAAIGPLRILALAGTLRALASLTGEFLVGAGRPGSYRAMTLLQLAVATVAIGPGLARGAATGVAIAMALAAGGALIWGWVAARIPLGVSFARMPATLGPAVAAFAVALAAGLLARAALPDPLGVAGVAGLAVLQTACFLAAWWRTDVRLRRLLARAGAAMPAGRTP